MTKITDVTVNGHEVSIVNVNGVCVYDTGATVSYSWYCVKSNKFVDCIFDRGMPYELNLYDAHGDDPSPIPIGATKGHQCVMYNQKVYLRRGTTVLYTMPCSGSSGSSSFKFGMINELYV